MSGASAAIPTPIASFVISSGSVRRAAHQRQNRTEPAIAAVLMIDPNDNIQVIGIVRPKNSSW